MAKEPSSSTSNDTSSSKADSYIGSFLSVISKSEIRYEGILYYLDPQDSTLGLKNVKSCGTEGRMTNGPQVPPSDRVYEYILFRGSDIKDLQVKTAPAAPTEEPIYNDPAIIQTSYYGEASSTAVPAATGSLTDFKLYSEPPPLNVVSYPSILPPHDSGTQFGISGSLSTHSAILSNGIPTQWQGYSGTPGSILGAQQHSLSSNTTSYPAQNQSSTAIAPPNLFNNVSHAHSLATSSSIYLNALPALTSEPLSMPFADSFSSKSSLPFHQSTLVNSNGLTMPFPLTYQNASSIEAPVVNKVAPDHISSLFAQSSVYSTPSVSDPILDPLPQQPMLLTPKQLSQPTTCEYSWSKNSYPGQKDVSENFTSLATAPAAQPPLLPLPPPSQKLQYSSNFTEEFDFQAMNEKFKKDEVWGNLGKGNQREKTETIYESGTSNEDLGDNNPGSASKSESKPAYNKDDFFDSISCNSVGRGARSGQNRSSERFKLDSETFGNFQQRTPSGGHGAGRGEYRGACNRGRGYNYHRRGRGGYMQR